MLSNPGMLIAGVTAVIAIAALIPAGLGPQEAATTRVDQTFVRPFAFTVPPGTGIELYPGPLTSRDQRLSDRLHVFSASRASGEGITVWIVDGVQSDVCAESAVVPRQPGRVPGVRPVELGATLMPWFVTDHAFAARLRFALALVMSSGATIPS